MELHIYITLIYTFSYFVFLDPNVDVIYVSPIDIGDELTQYYGRLIGLKPAIDSGNSDDQLDLSDRYKMIVPEAMKSFPVSTFDESFKILYINLPCLID